MNMICSQWQFQRLNIDSLVDDETSNDKSSDDKARDSELEKHAEGNSNSNEDSDDDGNNAGGPENLGPFENIEQAIAELENFAQSNNFSIVKAGSNYDKKIEGKPQTIKNATYVWTRYGKPSLKKYVPKSDQVAHRNTKSQRCGCEFKTYISRKRKGTTFSITMKEAKHNHILPEEQLNLKTKKKKITPEQIKLILSLHKAGGSPTGTKETLTQQYPDQLFSQKSVYSAIGKARKGELNGLTPIQFLISKLDSHTYKTDVVLSGDNGRVECLFILRKNMLSVYNRFPTALVMDATYKTNRFGLPLVQVCGITNENTTFVLCQAFMRSEHEDKYEWLLKQLKKHCFANHIPVSIISTDRDLSLLNAMRTELPKVKHFLCRWHISKNVLAHIPKVFNGLEKESVDNILKDWNTLVSPHTEEEYTKNLAAMIRNLPKRNAQRTVYNPSLFKEYNNIYHRHTVARAQRKVNISVNEAKSTRTST